MTNFRTATRSAFALVLSFASLAAYAGECRIDWHPRGQGLLAVYKDGAPYKNRAYISHDDVVRLHDFLVTSVASRSACPDPSQFPSRPALRRPDPSRS